MTSSNRALIDPYGNFLLVRSVQPISLIKLIIRFIFIDDVIDDVIERLIGAYFYCKIAMCRDLIFRYRSRFMSDCFIFRSLGLSFPIVQSTENREREQDRECVCVCVCVCACVCVCVVGERERMRGEKERMRAFVSVCVRRRERQR